MSYTPCQQNCLQTCFVAKLVVADEVSAHIEPRRVMAVLMNVGKSLQIHNPEPYIEIRLKQDAPHPVLQYKPDSARM